MQAVLLHNYNRLDYKIMLVKGKVMISSRDLLLTKIYSNWGLFLVIINLYSQHLGCSICIAHFASMMCSQS